MWTTENRPQYDRVSGNPSDLTDAEWDLVKPLCCLPRVGGERGQPDSVRDRESEREERRKGGPSIDPPGYDAGKKIKGKKRHVLVDTLDLMLHAIVHPADIQAANNQSLGASIAVDVRSPPVGIAAQLPVSANHFVPNDRRSAHLEDTRRQPRDAPSSTALTTGAQSSYEYAAGAAPPDR
jgi:hypothetical protein